MIVLHLPLPCTVSKRGRTAKAVHYNKTKYMQSAWLCALQSGTLPVLDPPQYMQVTSTLYLRNLRDEDNAMASLKWALDSLQKNVKGKCKWRQNVRVNCGYFVDDSPRHLLIHKPRQVLDRKSQGLTLMLSEVTTPEE